MQKYCKKLEKSCGLFFYSCFLLCGKGYAGEVNVQVQSAAGAALENAVVVLEASNPVANKVTAAVSIAQKNKTFLPFVSVVQTGTSVSFPNQDSVRHHVYSFSPAKKFELKLYSGVPSNPVVFDQAGTVVLGCNIHDNMLAYVYVVDTPYFGKTLADGTVKLINIPAGEYQLKVWHPKQKNENSPVAQAVNLKDKLQLTVNLDTQ